MPSKHSANAGYKMVIVVRGELRLTPGKAAVQVAHAAVMLSDLVRSKNPEALKLWMAGGQKKIALVAETLDDLEALGRQARARGVPMVLVEDAGFTEVPPGTKTCLGLGPAPAADVDAVTGELDLL